MPLEAAFAALTIGDGVARGVVRRAHALRLCEGHFPGEPIVPGAQLAGLMAELAAALVAPTAALAALERCVFTARVTPEDEIVVSARRVAATRVDAEVRRRGASAARATLRFRTEA